MRIMNMRIPNNNDVAKMESECNEAWAEMLDLVEEDIVKNTLLVTLACIKAQTNPMTPRIIALFLRAAGMRLILDATRRNLERMEINEQDSGR